MNDRVRADISGSHPTDQARSGLGAPRVDPGRELRAVFKPAYHMWREAVLRKNDCDECGGGIPWDGNDLLEMLALDLERELARKESA